MSRFKVYHVKAEHKVEGVEDRTFIRAESALQAKLKYELSRPTFRALDAKVADRS